ncbi:MULTISPECIES: NPP1 family protein [unclassified Streptomyces]|uniref:NPP1 family protein n=1 Tax=unclassified Streptomyces TaxID=2593676 RepID=UPI00331E3879
MSHAVKGRRPSRLAKAVIVAGSAAALTVGLSSSAFAAAPAALPYQASAFQDKYQPLFDYDSDGCFPSSAVGPDGQLNGGLNPSGNPGGDCRYVGSANTYVRTACDPNWCAYVYALYFEKDQGRFSGHRHDWEAVVVWQARGAEEPSYVSASAHGQYDTKPFNRIERSGNRAKIVYHRDEPGTHAFRFAKSGEAPEVVKDWDRPNLVAMDRLRNTNGKAFDALWNATWGSANFPLQDRDARFETTLNRAKPSQIRSFTPHRGL